VRAPFRLAVHRNHPLARRQRATPAEVARERLPAFCQRDYPEYRDMFTSWLREHRQQLRIAAEYDGVDSLLAAVESGLGVAIVATQPARDASSRNASG
jgi:DNA-binding transcriptional LysR family regulator